MADGAQRAAAAGHWLQAAPPNFRRQVVDKIVRDLSRGLKGSPPPTLNEAAANFEDTVLRESSSMQEYLTRIRSRMNILKLKMQRKMQGNAGQAIQGSCNSRTAAAAVMPQPASQPQNMHAVVKQEQPCGQPMVQLQMQAGNYAGWPGVRPNAQASHPLGQNAGVMGTQQRQPQQRPHPMMRNQQDLRVNQQRQRQPQQHPQPMMRNQQDLRVNQQQQQRYQTPHGAQRANVAVTQNGHAGHGHPGGQSNQQYGSPGSAGEVDWREVIFQKITLLKHAHFSELAEFGRGLAARAKTKEQLESASKEEANHYMAAARLQGKIKDALRFLQLQKSSLHEGHREQFGKCHMAVLDLVRMYREVREKGQIKARNAAARSSSQSCGAPPRATNPACGGVAPYAGGMNSLQKQHEQPAVVQTVSSSPPVQNFEAGAPPAALQQNHGDNLQHKQPAVQTLSSPSSAQDMVAGAPPAALQQNHGDNLQHEQPAVQTISSPPPAQNIEAGAPPSALQQSHHDQAEDDEVVTGSAEAQAAIITNLTGGTASFGGGTCSQQEQQERRPADERIPRSMTQHVSAGTPPPAQQQNQSDDEVCQAQAAGDEVRGGAEGPASVAQEETPIADMMLRGVRAARSLSSAARRSLADDMGVNLKRTFRREPAWPLDIIIDEWERRQRQSSSGGESGYKRRRTTYYRGALLDGEIRSASAMLVDTAIVVVTGDVAGARWSTEIEFRYSAASLTPDLKLAVNASEISARLLVPGDYPISSPVLLGDEARKEGVPGAVDVAFRRALRSIPEPRVIEAMARVWDSCAREAVGEFAHRLGGGTFSSRYGRLESCAGA